MISIYCCGCHKNTKALLKTGKDIYPHREGLYSLKFYQCKHCLNYIGTHKGHKVIPRPLGIIPTPKLRKARMHIHCLLDPIWLDAKDKKRARGKVYKFLTESLGYEYHTANLQTIEEAREVYKLVRSYIYQHRKNK